MTRAVKAPVWREMRVGDTWHRKTVWRARTGGWRLEVGEATRGWGHTPTGMWFFTGEHPDGGRVNSAWTEYGKYWRSREGAQAAAVKGAREGWAFLQKSAPVAPLDNPDASS